MQNRLELTLYAADPLGIAGGPLDEYASVVMELISALTRSRAAGRTASIQWKIPEADTELISRIAATWLEYPILHEINVAD